jgi:uncharacterized protein YndB with AHSA1/START domain
MTATDFATTIMVDQTPEEVFEAINNVRGWWAEDVEGDTEKVDDEFTHHYGNVHRCKIKIIESVPGKKIAWLVLDNYFKFTTDKTEWIGNRITFDISQKDGKTQLRFTHLGLVPEYECYDICFNAWTGYINDSLHKLLTTGKGQPNPKEEE